MRFRNASAPGCSPATATALSRSWTDPAGSRSHFGALLLGYYTYDGCLHYAGRADTGFNEQELARLAGGVVKPLETPACPWPSGRRARTGSAQPFSWRGRWCDPIRSLTNQMREVENPRCVSPESERSWDPFFEREPVAEEVINDFR